MMERQDIHVLPVVTVTENGDRVSKVGSHFTDGTPCPCNPDRWQPCPECYHLNPDAEKEIPLTWVMAFGRQGCHQCGGGGLVPPWCDDYAILQVHH